MYICVHIYVNIYTHTLTQTHTHTHIHAHIFNIPLCTARRRWRDRLRHAATCPPVCDIALQCVTVRYSVLQHVTLCCSAV